LVEALQAGVAKGDAVDVAGDVQESFVSIASVLAVGDPFPFPRFLRDLIQELRLLEGLPDLGAEEDGEDPAGDKEIPTGGVTPSLSVMSQSSRGDQEVGMRMVEQSAGPAVEHREQAGPRTEPAWLGEECLQRLRGARHEDPVEDLRLGSGERTELIRHRESDQVVGAG
jgi:hypothetical protein